MSGFTIIIRMTAFHIMSGFTIVIKMTAFHIMSGFTIIYNFIFCGKFLVLVLLPTAGDHFITGLAIRMLTVLHGINYVCFCID